jgi:hypothetical protein
MPREINAPSSVPINTLQAMIQIMRLNIPTVYDEGYDRGFVFALLIIGVRATNRWK